VGISRIESVLALISDRVDIIRTAPLLVAACRMPSVSEIHAASWVRSMGSDKRHAGPVPSSLHCRCLDHLGHPHLHCSPTAIHRDTKRVQLATGMTQQVGNLARCPDEAIPADFTCIKQERRHPPKNLPAQRRRFEQSWSDWALLRRGPVVEKFRRQVAPGKSWTSSISIENSL